MKSIVLLLLFVGMFMIVNGIYEQKLKSVETKTKIEYRFIPRSYYEEQLSGNADVTNKLGDMWNHASPWFDQMVGSGLDVLKSDVKTDNAPKN